MCHWLLVGDVNDESLARRSIDTAVSYTPIVSEVKLIVALKIAAPAEVKISCPKELIAGGTLNKPVLSSLGRSRLVANFRGRP
ncbi:hypothetical protein QUA21_21315 [Microcoleus sp. Pol1B3]|uniref:hypothetical protein n=1 Tax=Microcoleus sp. POL1_C1 TaxID=2818870 RepID=UPI002FCFB4AD